MGSRVHAIYEVLRFGGAFDFCPGWRGSKVPPRRSAAAAGVEISDETCRGFLRPERKAPQAFLVSRCEVTFLLPVREMIARFGERAPGNARKVREFARPERAKAFGQITWTRAAGFPDLFAEFEIFRDCTLFDQSENRSRNETLSCHAINSSTQCATAIPGGMQRAALSQPRGIRPKKLLDGLDCCR